MYALYDGPWSAYAPGEYRIKHVTEKWERAQCAQLRRDVFCAEQRVFDVDDRDSVDDIAITIATIYCTAGMPEQVVGTVRIHEQTPQQWIGSRLAVTAEFRGAGWIGAELIKHAVCTAHARGCAEFLAHVQVQNVRLFQRLHWQKLAEESIHGRPHALMRADLAAYPPRHANEVRFVKALRKVA
jgi:putative N-acetyltransferase (TIGR04045 family)